MHESMTDAMTKRVTIKDQEDLKKLLLSEVKIKAIQSKRDKSASSMYYPQKTTQAQLTQMVTKLYKSRK